MVFFFFLAMFCPILKTPSLLAFPSPFSVILQRDLWREFWLGIYFSFSIVSKIATILGMACMNLFWLFLSPRLGANLPQGSFKKRSRSPSVLQLQWELPLFLHFVKFCGVQSKVVFLFFYLLMVKPRTFN